LPLLPRLVCEAVRAIPRGWSRILPLVAHCAPCLRDVVLDIDICGPMHMDLRESVCNILLRYGYYPHQQAEDRIVSYIVKPDMIVFDIGANIGWYSCLIHRLTEGRGRIIAVEPMPRALRLLRGSAVSRANIRILPCAIGEASGYGHLCEAGSLDLSRVSYSSVGDVEVVTIDDLAARFGQPDFIKLDVEGAELAAFRGAVKTLSGAHPPYILFEYIPANTIEFGTYPLMQLLETLKLGSYSCFRIGHEAQLYPIGASTESTLLTNDYLAVPPHGVSNIRSIATKEVR